MTRCSWWASFEYQFKGAIIIDRRNTPSHGYRAVHVIVRHSGKLVEIQVLDKTSEMVARTEEWELELSGIPKEDRPQTADSRLEELKTRLFTLLKTKIDELKVQ